MFVISLSYTKPLADVEQQLAAHIEYIDHYYGKGVFLASGRKVPRTGGIILARADSLAEIQTIVQLDPFYIAGVAEFEITEFVPTKAASELQALIE